MICMTQKYIVLDIETDGLNPWYGDRVTSPLTISGSASKVNRPPSWNSLIKHTDTLTGLNRLGGKRA